MRAVRKLWSLSGQATTWKNYLKIVFGLIANRLEQQANSIGHRRTSYWQ